MKNEIKNYTGRGVWQCWNCVRCKSAHVYILKDGSAVRLPFCSAMDEDMFEVFGVPCDCYEERHNLVSRFDYMKSLDIVEMSRYLAKITEHGKTYWLKFLNEDEKENAK